MAPTRREHPRIEFGVLGPVTAWDGGAELPLKGPRHRAVLARLLVARGRVVPMATLVDDLWDRPPPGAAGAVQTFVSALRRVLEPGRAPRSPARLLVTAGTGYALRADPVAVDADRFERCVTRAPDRSPAEVLDGLGRASGWWRGPAYADVATEPWARSERARLTELRSRAVELRAAARLDLGLAAEAVADLDAHVADHPWREEGWRLLALALYRSDRRGDATAVLRRARTLLREQLGLDPGPALRRLETDILAGAARLTALPPTPADAAARVWSEAATSYQRTVATSSRARLRSTVDLLREMAVSGGSGLLSARRQRVAAIHAAEQAGDPELTAAVIGAYDVPAIWSRVDDPEQAAQVVAAAERTLAALPPRAPDTRRARLLATIAVESRGAADPRARWAAVEAERLARRSDDPALLAFALNGVFMQSFGRAGLAGARDAVGAELVELSTRHGLATYQVLGRLVRLQARAALGDTAGADGHATAVDALAERHEAPLVGVFTGWYRALRTASGGHAEPHVEAAAYRDAAALLDGAGMPGLRRGLLPLALLTCRIRHHLPAPAGADLDWGPHEPWARPLVLLAAGRHRDAARAVRDVPDPPHDHLIEALWVLTARAALAVGDRDTMLRARTALLPARLEIAGAGSGLLTLGPVAAHLDELTVALRR